MITLWLHFLISSLFVTGAGLYIGRVSGELGERLKLGKAWAGAVLLSLATTLPELITTVTVVWRGETGLAFGGVLGSMVFNLFILVVVDIFDTDPIYHRLSTNHLLTGLLGCVLLSAVVFGLSLGQVGTPQFKDIQAISFIGISSIAIIFFYIAGQIILFQLAKSENAEPLIKIATAFDRFSTKQIFGIYFGLAGIIIIAAYQLGIAAENLGRAFNFSATFAGATLIGIVTSLPEFTNGIVCARPKEYDLAMGNILGANAFVIVVLAIADLLYLKGSIFSFLSPTDFHELIGF